MEKTVDESKRISRLSAQKAQDYLREIKGDLYSRYRSAWAQCSQEQISPDRPLQLNVELTAACNLCCDMCYRNYEMDVRRGCLSLADIENLAWQFQMLGIPSLWLSGGEPLMHPQIEKVLKTFAAVSPIDFWLVSNGLLLSEKLSEIVVDSKLTWLSISIDAAKASTYKKIRGGNYGTLVKNIETFLAVRARKHSVLPFLRVSFIRMPQNAGEEDEFVFQWQDKADIIDFQTLADYHNLDSIPDEMVKSSDYICTAPFTLVSVTPSGDIIPCCNGFYGDRSPFNIRNTSLGEYWSSSFHASFAKSIKEKNYCSECIKCMKSFLPH